jgi:hypothetical protein
LGTSLKLIGSMLTALLSASVLAGVSDGAVDVPDGAIIVVALAVLARTAIRMASETTGKRQPRE